MEAEGGVLEVEEILGEVEEETLGEGEEEILGVDGEVMEVVEGEVMEVVEAVVEMVGAVKILRYISIFMPNVMSRIKQTLDKKHVYGHIPLQIH